MSLRRRPAFSAGESARTCGDKNALVAGELRELVVEGFGNRAEQDAQIGRAFVRLNPRLRASHESARRQQTT